MYNKGLYHPWVPKFLQVVLIFLSLIFILPAGGVYSANMSIMYPDLGAMSEQFSFANNATTIGMALALPQIFAVIKHFRSKELVIGCLSIVALLSLVISQTDSPYVIIVLSFIMGFFKYFALLVFILPVMTMVSPKGERAQFYFFFYPFSICMGQVTTYVTASLTYDLNWRSIYLMMAIALLVCALLALIFMHNKRGGKQVKMIDVDVLSPALLGCSLLTLNYIFTFAKQQDWFNSVYIQFAVLAFFAFTGLFIYRQTVIEKPYIGLKFFKTRNVLTSIVVILLMGMFLATAVLQTYFTTILGYDNVIINLLNLSMLPGILIGAFVCILAKKRGWGIKPVVFFAFTCFLISAIMMYFLIAPVIRVEYLIIPIFLKGIGMCILYITVSLYIIDKIGPLDMMPVVSVFMCFRTFIGTSFFSAVFTWALYKLQLQQVANLASGMDAIDHTLQVYGKVSMQATLMAVKQIFGYVVLAGIIILVFVLLHPFQRIHHRKLVLSRKRFRGESTKGYREKVRLNEELTGAALSANV